MRHATNPHTSAAANTIAISRNMNECSATPHLRNSRAVYTHHDYLSRVYINDRRAPINSATCAKITKSCPPPPKSSPSISPTRCLTSPPKTKNSPNSSSPPNNSKKISTSPNRPTKPSWNPSPTNPSPAKPPPPSSAVSKHSATTAALPPPKKC